MWNVKIYTVFAIIAISFSSTNAQGGLQRARDSDWEVILQAINNPNSVTLPVLQHSIFRILASFVPQPRP